MNPKVHLFAMLVFCLSASLIAQDTSVLGTMLQDRLGQFDPYDDEYDYYDDYDDEEDDWVYVAPTRWTYQDFRKATDRAAHGAGYQAMSMGFDDHSEEYAAMYRTEEMQLLTFFAVSLMANPDWHEEVLMGMGEVAEVEALRVGGHDLYYVEIYEPDEEYSEVEGLSAIYTGIRNKDAILIISTVPITSRQKLVDIFQQLGL